VRGRPRKSSSEKAIRGTSRPDRDSGSQDLPPATGTPIRPKTLSIAAAKFWNYIVPLLIKSGVVAEIDGPVLAKMCEWHATGESLRAELGKFTGPSTDRYRCVMELTAAEKNFERLSAKFGLSPTDRSRLRLQKPKAAAVERPGAKYRN
jgi:phage terminase small subunit